MQTAIFISYRRLDGPGMAGWIRDDLQKRLPNAAFFLDVGEIKPGRDFRQVLRENVAKADAVIALIGPNWLAREADGSRRIDDVGDLVRLEIAKALELKIPIVPVLLDGTQMPAARELPDDIRPLAAIQAHHFRQSRFSADAQDLAHILEELTPHAAWKNAKPAAAASKTIGAMIAAGAAAAAVWFIASREPPTIADAPYVPIKGIVTPKQLDELRQRSETYAVGPIPNTAPANAIESETGPPAAAAADMGESRGPAMDVPPPSGGPTN
ncbi:MAG: toll/interleukin-1 receptor domain-containing protein [Hyphomicrobium sp.]